MSYSATATTTEPPRKTTPNLFRTLRSLVIAFAIMTSPIWGFWLLLMYSFSYGPGRGDYPAVAPDADFETRRAWGQKEMFTYFKLTEQWVRNSSLIADDVGAVTGVAPIGSPNRFYAGGFTDGAHCVMNLQVIGEKGEGILRLPVVNVNNMRELYGIAEKSTWKFGDKIDVISLSGKSQLEELGLDLLVDQVRDYAQNDDHVSVLETCELLRDAGNDTGENTFTPLVGWNDKQNDWFDNLPFIYRVEMLHQNAESLFQLGRDDEALKVFRNEAALHVEYANLFRYGNSSHELSPADLPRSLEAARIALMQASSLRADDKKTIGLARQRALIVHEVQCDNFESWFGDDAAEREAIKRSLGGLYNCVVHCAKKSDWLKQQMGAMSFRPKLNHCNNIRINHHGLYQATVVVEVSGSFGRKGVLEVQVREYEDNHKPLDLNAVTLRDPMLPYGLQRVRWTGGDGDKIKLSSKTMAPRKKKK